MLESIGLQLFLAAAGGAVAGNLLSWIAKRIDAIVRKTDTKIDDAIWNTVRGAMSEAMSDFNHDKQLAQAFDYDEDNTSEYKSD